jgi:hypothetical protein
MKTCDECKNYKQKELAAHLESLKPKYGSKVYWESHIADKKYKQMSKQDRKELFERGRSVGYKAGVLQRDFDSEAEYNRGYNDGHKNWIGYILNGHKFCPNCGTKL